MSAIPYFHSFLLIHLILYHYFETKKRDYIADIPVASVDNEEILRTYAVPNLEDKEKASNTVNTILEAIS